MLCSRILYLIMLMALFECCNSPYKGLRKLSYEELYQRAYNVVIDPPTKIYKDIHHRDIHPDALKSLNRDSFALDKYVDRSDSVRLCVVRKVKAEDIASREAIKKLYDENIGLKIRWIKATVKDTVAQQEMIEMAYYTMPIQPVSVSCDSTKYLLEQLLSADQNNRNGSSSDWRIDRHNQIQVVSIIENCGFPDSSTVGNQAMYALFLVIQHGPADLRYKYYPVLQKKAEHGDFDKSWLALMEDRILTDQGKKQKFGSQVRMNKGSNRYELIPIEDPAHVDERRAAVGLGSISQYLEQFNIRWEQPEPGKN